MGRIPRRARERRRRAAALVAQRTAAAALLPGAPAARRAAAAALRDRRRDRDRHRRSDRLRRDADAPPSRREPHPQALGRDPGAVRRLRRARCGRATAIWQQPFAERRARARARRGARSRSPRPSPTPSSATAWLDELELLGLDGVVAKRLDRAGRARRPRRGRQGEAGAHGRLRRRRRALEVEARSKIATLLLGLYDDDGEIDYVGSAAVAASRHDAIAEQVMPLLDEASDRRFSEPNRWGGSGLEEQPLRPELVAEVRYDKVQGTPLPPRHEAAALPAGQGSALVHVGRAPAAARAAGPTVGDLLGARDARRPAAAGQRSSLPALLLASSAPATAARAAARPASSGSSAGTAPRRRRPPRRARPTRAAPAGRRRCRRSPPARRRARRSAAASRRA